MPSSTRNWMWKKQQATTLLGSRGQRSSSEILEDNRSKDFVVAESSYDVPSYTKKKYWKSNNAARTLSDAKAIASRYSHREYNNESREIEPPNSRSHLPPRVVREAEWLQQIPFDEGGNDADESCGPHDEARGARSSAIIREAQRVCFESPRHDTRVGTRNEVNNVPSLPTRVRTPKKQASPIDVSESNRSKSRAFFEQGSHTIPPYNQNSRKSNNENQELSYHDDDNESREGEQEYYSFPRAHKEKHPAQSAFVEDDSNDNADDLAYPCGHDEGLTDFVSAVATGQVVSDIFPEESRSEAPLNCSTSTHVMNADQQGLLGPGDGLSPVDFVRSFSTGEVWVDGTSPIDFMNAVATGQVVKDIFPGNDDEERVPVEGDGDTEGQDQIQDDIPKIISSFVNDVSSGKIWEDGTSPIDFAKAVGSGEVLDDFGWNNSSNETNELEMPADESRGGPLQSLFGTIEDFFLGPADLDTTTPNKPRVVREQKASDQLVGRSVRVQRSTSNNIKTSKQLHAAAICRSRSIDAVQESRKEATTNQSRKPSPTSLERSVDVAVSRGSSRFVHSRSSSAVSNAKVSGFENRGSRTRSNSSRTNPSLQRRRRMV